MFTSCRGNMLNAAAAAAMKATQPNHVLLHELSTDSAKLVAYMDERDIECLGLINYLSPDVMGYTEADTISPPALPLTIPIALLLLGVSIRGSPQIWPLRWITCAGRECSSVRDLF